MDQIHRVLNTSWTKIRLLIRSLIMKNFPSNNEKLKLMVYFTFLAYFLEYAIVRTSTRYYFSYGCPIGAIYGSIDSLPGVWFISSDELVPADWFIPSDRWKYTCQSYQCRLLPFFLNFEYLEITQIQWKWKTLRCVSDFSVF